MRSRQLTIVVLSGLIVSVASQGQQPSPRTPAFPAINPAVARLESAVGGLDGPGLALAYAEEAGLLIAGCERGSLCFYPEDVIRGLKSADTAGSRLQAQAGPVLALACSHGVLASAGTGGKILLWDLSAGKQTHALQTTAVVRALALSADGKTLASAGDDASVHLWDATTGKAGLKLTGPTDWLLAVALSPDGKTVAAGGFDGKLRLWETTSGQKRLEVPVQPAAVAKMPPPSPTNVSAIAFSPDGKTVLAGGQDGVIYQFGTDGKLARTLTGHTSAITALAYHPAGAMLASSSKDRTVRLWNLANGQVLKVLEGHGAWVQGIAFVTRGSRLASVSADQTVRVWDLTEPARK